MEMVMGLPSSGIEYEVRSVLRDRSVARSVSLSMELGSSVGAGRGGFRVSTPIVVADLADHRFVRPDRFVCVRVTFAASEEQRWKILRLCAVSV